jgi:hypothetical protein
MWIARGKSLMAIDDNLPRRSRDQAEIMGAHASGFPLIKLLKTMCISAIIFSSLIGKFCLVCENETCALRGGLLSMPG